MATGEEAEKETRSWAKIIHDPRSSREQVTSAYDVWAKHGYDENLTDLSHNQMYSANDVLSDAVAKLFPVPDKQNVRILDVAAGTGLTGLELSKRGFSNIDGLDPSSEMLEMAKKKGIYKNFICDYISDKQLDIEKGSYDCITLVGGLGPGHIPKVAMHEMIRLVKSGGYIVFVINEDFTHNVEEYKDLEPFMARLETESKWRQTKKECYDHHFLQSRGILFIYQVL